MAWKVVWGILTFFVASGTLWTTLGLAKVEDLSQHNLSKTAHSVSLDGQVLPVPEAIEKNYVSLKALRKSYDVVVTVKIDLDTDRAERLADRAADKVEDPRQSREVWKTVRDAALENLRAQRPIRASLERYLD